MANPDLLDGLKKIRQYLLTGVSYAIPFVACGGILIALSITLAGVIPGSGPDWAHAPTWVLLIKKVGETAFGLLLPVLAGYISFAMAGRPGLVAGFLGGFLCNDLRLGAVPDHPVTTGFLGAIIAGLLAGFVVNQIKRIPIGKFLRPIMPILIIPILSSLIVGAIMVLIAGPPIAAFNAFLGDWLRGMGTGNMVLLALILGAMIAFDMGGPVNKAAFFFGFAMIKEGNLAVMGACAAAICTPPLGMGLATLINKKLWSEEDREAGIAALTMGLVGITEGAIPFAAADPLKVIPSIMLGSMLAATVAMLGGVGDPAPHGGPIVIPLVDNKIAYVIAILAGTALTALSITFLKLLGNRKSATPETTTEGTASA